MKAIQELRLLISSELERMKDMLAERRKMLLAGATRDPVGSSVSQKVSCLHLRLALSLIPRDKVRTTLYSAINSTTGKYCLVAFI